MLFRSSYTGFFAHGAHSFGPQGFGLERQTGQDANDFVVWLAEDIAHGRADLAHEQHLSGAAPLATEIGN